MHLYIEAGALCEKIFVHDNKIKHEISDIQKTAISYFCAYSQAALKQLVHCFEEKLT
jgi:hypothetical protein